MNDFTTQSAALAQPMTERAGDLLVRFVHADGSRTYSWLTAVDVDEYALYDSGDFDFEVIELTQYSGTLPSNPPAHVDSSQWDDRDNG